MQTPAANTPPVLTGMPVSGMAYLDRPQEAGYFLFPDLSVRHEGRYRLTFNLYEQTKDEKDMDADERLLASEEGKNLSSKERRQLRNKVSARAFRSRRKGMLCERSSPILQMLIM